MHVWFMLVYVIIESRHYKYDQDLFPIDDVNLSGALAKTPTMLSATFIVLP